MIGRETVLSTREIGPPRRLVAGLLRISAAVILVAGPMFIMAVRHGFEDLKNTEVTRVFRDLSTWRESNQELWYAISVPVCLAMFVGLWLLAATGRSISHAVTDGSVERTQASAEAR